MKRPGAKNVTKTIPVVMAFGGDGEKRGDRCGPRAPRWKHHGLTLIDSEIIGKRLELLKEIIPKLSHVGYLWSDLSRRDEMKEIETVARTLRLGFQSLEVKGPDDFERAFRAATKGVPRVLCWAAARVPQLSRKTDHRAGKESASSDVYYRSVCRGRRTDVLWGGSFRDVPARRRDRG